MAHTWSRTTVNSPRATASHGYRPGDAGHCRPVGGLGRAVISRAAADEGYRNPLAPREPHFPVKAKHIIHLFMNGGPSHVDTFDPKPALAKYAGKTLPMENLRTERKTGAAFPCPYKFEKYGESGIEVSEIFQHTAQHIDDIAVIRSMHADVPNHEPSLLLMNCGDSVQVRPSLGSWMTYGLGDGQPESARIHCHVPGRIPDSGNAELAIGVLARRIPGHVHRHQAYGRRQTSRKHQESGSLSRSTTPPAGCLGGAEPAAQRTARTRPRAGSSHSLFRIGLQNADGSDGRV